MNLCIYKDILGEVNKGVHSYRLYDIAIIDVIMTLIFSYIINIITTINLYKIIIILFILGIIMHRLFCVRTTIDKLLFQ